MIIIRDSGRNNYMHVKK